MASRRKGWTAGIIAGATLFAGGLLTGGLITLLGIRAAYASAATADPSEKARVLAEGISEAMNGAVIGTLVSLFGAAILIACAIGSLSPRGKDGDGPN